MKRIRIGYLVLCLIPVVSFSQIKLTVSTIPKSVEVILDGESIGESPIKDGWISPGEHQFNITKEGYAPLTYDLLVNPSQAIHLDFFLNPIYSIQFKTEETGLVFELNEEHRWEEKNIKMQLEAGDHFLRVYKLNKIIDEQTILVDEPKKYQYYLKKPVAEL